MKSILPIFTCVSLSWFCQDAFAQRPLPMGNQPFNPVRPLAARPNDNNSGNALLARAVTEVDGQASISAKVRQKVDLLGRELVGTGIYLQQGRGPQRLLRFELKLQAANKTNSTLQICDGTTLWIHEDLTDRKNLSRVDISRLRGARPKLPQGLASNVWLALDGLSKLLMNLDNTFQFGPVVEGRLDTVPVWTIEGQWRPSKLVQLLPDQKAAIEAGKAADTRNLQPNLPDRVVLHLGCDDLFPYVIEYWRSQPADKSAKTNPRGRLLTVLEMFEVQLGATIDPRQFSYQPGALQPVDRTQEFFDKFGLEEVGPPGANRGAAPRR
jgi:hypothetical protein